jgi:outer membrane receptor protein involved in Fe transport
MQKHLERKAAIRRPWTTALLATTILGGASPALAQQASGVEEIIVTAQKRDENLQDVPISVLALTTERLEDLHVSDFSDYVKFLPSVSFSATYGPSFNRPFMRGVASGENGNHSGSLPSVGTYLDEQPITTITGALDVHIYDIARVEVLAGPQGTLYGASSEAGTIRIITNKPDSSAFAAGFSTEVNSVADGDIGSSAEGFVNIPVNDRVAVRLVAWAAHDAGYIDNVEGTRLYPTSGVVDSNADVAEDNYNTVDTYGMRAALRVDLNDTWTVTPSIMGQFQRSNGVFAEDPLIGERQVQHNFPEFTRDIWGQAALTVQGQISNLDITYTTALMRRELDSNQDYADYGYFYDTFLGYGSYFTDDGVNPINPAQQVEGRDFFNKESHELRIASPVEDRLRFIAGLFYQRQEHEIHQRYIITDFFDAHEVTGWDDTVWLTEQNRVDRDYAAFGEVSFDFTDRLTGTAGIRYYRYSNSLDGYHGFSDAFATFFGFGFPYPGEQTCLSPQDYRGAPCANINVTKSDNGETHRLNLEYEIDEDRMIYATYSTGYRPGGVNRRAPLPPYDADFLTNYEFGWKTTWGENTLRWNGAIFLEQWEDFQFGFLGQSGLTVIQNAGNAEIRGLESDVTWAPTPNLTLTGAATFLDTEMTETTTFAPEGTPLPVAPDVKANLTARYEWEVGSWTPFFQASVVYTGESSLDIRPTESALIGTLDPYTLVDASGGIGFNGFDVELFISNVFDENAEISRYTECAIGTCFGNPYSVIARPRTIGLRIGREF